jgi:hypothetical protein
MILLVLVITISTLFSIPARTHNNNIEDFASKLKLPNENIIEDLTSKLKLPNENNNNHDDGTEDDTVAVMYTDLTSKLILSSRQRQLLPKAPLNLPSFEGEFGFEIMYWLPYAYFLHQYGLLNSTTSCGHIDHLYWFSPHHTNKVPCLRKVGFIENNYFDHLIFHGCSNIPGHRNVHKCSVVPFWLAPPTAERFRRLPLPRVDKIALRKPLLFIGNKYEPEGNDFKPVNFYDVNLLKDLIRHLLPHYTIFYHRENTHEMKPRQEATFSKEPPLQDYEMLTKEFAKEIKEGSLYLTRSAR